MADPRPPQFRRLLRHHAGRAFDRVDQLLETRPRPLAELARRDEASPPSRSRRSAMAPPCSRPLGGLRLVGRLAAEESAGGSGDLLARFAASCCVLPWTELSYC